MSRLSIISYGAVSDPLILLICSILTSYIIDGSQQFIRNEAESTMRGLRSSGVGLGFDVGTKPHRCHEGRTRRVHVGSPRFLANPKLLIEDAAR